MYKFVTREDLLGAHDSLVDFKAQDMILFHNSFLKYCNKADSIQTVEKVFAPKKKADE